MSKVTTITVEITIDLQGDKRGKDIIPAFLSVKRGAKIINTKKISESLNEIPPVRNEKARISNMYKKIITEIGLQNISLSYAYTDDYHFRAHYSPFGTIFVVFNTISGSIKITDFGSNNIWQGNVCDPDFINEAKNAIQKKHPNIVGM